MLKTPLCDLLGIEVPIILAPMGTCTSAQFAAAVSNEGGLGGIGSLFRSTAAVKRDIEAVRKLTSRPFAINHIPQALDAEAFRYTLEAKPPVISFALDDPGDMIRQAHDVGSRVMLQVTTVAQAVRAAERGVDVIIAQGGESGGYCGEVSTMALVPQVVDAVSPIPVVAAGGIFDGRGAAAALMLGAAGINLGTRFLLRQKRRPPMNGSRLSRQLIRRTRLKLTFSTTLARFRVQGASQRSRDHCRPPSWRNGMANVRKLVASAIDCEARSSRRPRPVANMSVCSGQVKPQAASRRFFRLRRSCAASLKRQRQRCCEHQLLLRHPHSKPQSRR